MDKKIIFMSNLDIWSIGEGKGAPSFYNTIKAYVDDGWDVTLVQPKSRYRKNYNIDGCSIIKFNFCFYDFIKQIPKVRFFFRFFSYQCLTYLFCKTVKALIKQKGKCIVYAYEVDAVLAGKKICDELKCPLVMRFQGTILKDYKNTWVNRLNKFTHFKALKQKSDVIIMTDDGTQGNMVLKRLGNETEKIYFWKNGQTVYENLVNIPQSSIRKELNIPNTAPVLLTVSRLRYWKRVDRAINAMPSIIKEYPECRLVIIGDGDEYNRLVKLTEKLAITKNVCFAGAVKQENVWRYYSIADLFLSFYDLSNLGNPLMEAMRQGKAIVTLDVGDTNTVIQNEYNGILLKEDQLNKISETVVRLLDDIHLKEKLGKNAYEYAAQHFWTWDERMKAEITAINELRNSWVPKQ